MILSIETTTSVCSVALHQKGKLIASQILDKAKSHATHLVPMLDQLFSLAGSPALEAVAISQGPGSYTGLRIGTATAQGICLAKDLPLIAVDTLQAMTYSLPKLCLPADARYCPMLDARNQAVYSAVYDVNRKMVQPPQRINLPADYFAQLSQKASLICLGSGSDAYQDVLPETAQHIPACYPSAVHMGLPAYQKYQAKAFVDVDTFTPLYLGTFRNKKKGQKNALNGAYSKQ